jgi:hypothetical protein
LDVVKDKIPGAGTGFDDLFAFEFLVGPRDRGDTASGLAFEFAKRREPVTGPDGPRGDEFEDVLFNILIFGLVHLYRI